jgi:hypothetical protein
MTTESVPPSKHAVSDKDSRLELCREIYCENDSTRVYVNTLCGQDASVAVL